MDDHDLGALLDASVPARPASDAALSGIHHRAAQRRRRTAVLSGALTVAVVVALVLGLSALGPAKRATPATTPTPCASGAVSMSIDPHSSTFNETTQWAVTAVNRSRATCRVSAPITATIRDANGRIVTAIRGASKGAVLPTKPGYVSELAPGRSTLVGQLVWILPCSIGPVVLEAAGLSPSPAQLKVSRQQCIVGIDRSFFRISPVGDTVAGEACPFGSLTLAIDPNSTASGETTRWRVTATTRTGVLCRTGAGIEAAIERPDGSVPTITGNPARQTTMQWQDLFRPAHAEFVGYLTWTNPCSSTPVRVVVRFEDGSYGSPVALNLPAQRCLGVVTGHFGITLERTVTP